MLVISRYGLDCQRYNTKDEYVTWETCTLRNWLNSIFYEVAFIPEEKNLILNSTVTAEANPEYNAPAGNDTTDKVFLLSINEANRYFTDDAARACQGTPYSNAQGDYKADNGNCWWWLRSPGHNSGRAAYDLDDGGVFGYGNIVNIAFNAIRPAMWIDISSIPD